MATKNEEFKFEIIKHIVTLSEGSWNLELNYVKFGDNDPKLDIRKWNEDHTKMGKGISLTVEEFNKLIDSSDNVKKVTIPKHPKGLSKKSRLKK